MKTNTTPKPQAGGGGMPRRNIPETYQYTYKVQIYDDDGYIELGTLTQAERQDLEAALLETLVVGSTIEPIKCPVNGMQIDWDKGTVTIHIKLDRVPQPSAHVMTCTKGNLRGYINHQIVGADEYTLELR